MYGCSHDKKSGLKEDIQQDGRQQLLIAILSYPCQRLTHKHNRNTCIYVSETKELIYNSLSLLTYFLVSSNPRLRLKMAAQNGRQIDLNWHLCNIYILVYRVANVRHSHVVYRDAEHGKR
jgi:hypothetical protein